MQPSTSNQFTSTQPTAHLDFNAWHGGLPLSTPTSRLHSNSFQYIPPLGSTAAQTTPVQPIPFLGSTPRHTSASHQPRTHHRSPSFQRNASQHSPRLHAIPKHVSPFHISAPNHPAAVRRCTVQTSTSARPIPHQGSTFLDFTPLHISSRQFSPSDHTTPTQDNTRLQFTPRQPISPHVSASNQSRSAHDTPRLQVSTFRNAALQNSASAQNQSCPANPLLDFTSLQRTACQGTARHTTPRLRPLQSNTRLRIIPRRFRTHLAYRTSSNFTISYLPQSCDRSWPMPCSPPYSNIASKMSRSITPSSSIFKVNFNTGWST